MTWLTTIMRKIPLMQWIIGKTKAYRPPGFAGLTLHAVLVFFVEQAKKTGFSTRAAAISFNILMALPAGLIFLCTLVPYLPSAIEVEKELLSALDEVLFDQKAFQITVDIVHDFFSTQRSGLLSFSALAAIFFSSNAIMGIMHAFDRSYFEERSAAFLAKRWTAIKLTCVLIVLVLASILLLSVQGPLKTFLLNKLHINTPTTRWMIQIGRWAILLLLNFFTIAVIYRGAPAVKNRWPLASPGSIFACFLTIVTTIGFSIWVGAFGRFNEVYGSLGTVLILMNLLYINALVLLIGFELNVSITALRGKPAVIISAEATENPLGKEVIV